MEIFECRYCYDEYSDRSQVIVPCACSGTNKYVCKGCLNKCISIDKNNIKYTTCPSCHQLYKRDVPDIKEDINCQVKDEMLYGVGCLTFFTTAFLFLGKSTFVFVFLLLLLYLLSIIHIATHQDGIYTYLLLPIVIIYMIILFSPHEIAYVGFALWAILLYTFLSYKIINNGWELIYKSKYNCIIEDMKCFMYDNDLKLYVGGVM